MRTQNEIRQAIDSFERDAATTEYQRGYLAALEWAHGNAAPHALEEGQISAFLAKKE